MHIKIKQDFEKLINDIIKEETAGYVVPTPSQVVHGILEKVKKEREKNSQNKAVKNDDDSFEFESEE